MCLWAGRKHLWRWAGMVSVCSVLVCGNLLQAIYWSPGMCLVGLKSVSKLIRCRLLPGHLAGPGRQHLGTPTLCSGVYNAHTLCGTNTHHLKQMVGPGLHAPLAAPAPRVTWHSLGTWTAERKSPQRGDTELLLECWLPKLLLQNVLEIRGALGYGNSTLKTNGFSCPTYPPNNDVDPKCSQSQRSIQSDRGFESCLSTLGVNVCLLGNQCYRPNLAGMASEEPRFVCKRMAGVFLTPVALNYNRICNAVVVQIGALAIVSFTWHFPIFSWNAYIRNTILFYGIGQKLDKNQLEQSLIPFWSNFSPLLSLLQGWQLSSFPGIPFIASL